jgi:hypothetical protein
LLDGTCDIDQLMKITVEQKMPAVAMTDHGNLFGGKCLGMALRSTELHENDRQRHPAAKGRCNTGRTFRGSVWRRDARRTDNWARGLAPWVDQRSPRA